MNIKNGGKLRLFLLAVGFFCWGTLPAHAMKFISYQLQYSDNTPVLDAVVSSVGAEHLLSSNGTHLVYDLDQVESSDYILIPGPMGSGIFTLGLSESAIADNLLGIFTVVFKMPQFECTSSILSFEVDASNNNQLVAIQEEPFVNGGGAPGGVNPAPPVVKEAACVPVATQKPVTWPTTTLPNGTVVAKPGGGSSHWDIKNPNSTATGLSTKAQAIADVLGFFGVDGADLCVPNPACPAGQVCYPQDIKFPGGGNGKGGITREQTEHNPAPGTTAPVIANFYSVQAGDNSAGATGLTVYTQKCMCQVKPTPKTLQ